MIIQVLTTGMGRSQTRIFGNKSEIIRASKRILVVQLETRTNAPNGALKFLPQPNIWASQKPILHSRHNRRNNVEDCVFDDDKEAPVEEKSTELGEAICRYQRQPSNPIHLDSISTLPVNFKDTKDKPCKQVSMLELSHIILQAQVGPSGLDMAGSRIRWPLWRLLMI